jgi:hypothetical protein
VNEASGGRVDRAEFTQATRAMRDAVLDLVNFHEEERALLGHEPAMASPAWADDLKEHHFAAIEGHPCREPRLLGSVRLSLAEELIRAVCTLHAGPVAVLAADRILVRSVLEACGRALWLLDPTIDTEARVARGLIERLEDIRLQRNLVKGHPEHALAYQRQIERLSSEAEQAGFRVEHPRKHPSKVGGERRPSSSEAVAATLDTDAESRTGALAQGLFSLSVHANPIAMLMHRDDGDSLVDLGKGMYSVPLVMKSQQVNLLVGYCALSYVTAVNANRELMGWQSDRWDRIRMNVRNVSRRVMPDNFA